MNIPNFRAGVDVYKLKGLYDTLSKIVSINDKEYTMHFKFPESVLEIVKDNIGNTPCFHVEFDLDFDGDLLCCVIDDDDMFIGG